MSTIRRAPSESDRSSTTIVEGGHGVYTAMGYRSAQVANREGRSYSQAGGDAYLQYDRIKLINQSRAFYRDNAIYKGMVDRAVGYIVGNDFALQVKAGSPKTNAKIEGLWKRFWRRPEIRGLLSGSDVSQTVCRELILCGDTGALKTNKAVLQLVEAEQVDGGSMGTNGIEKDRYGTPVRYFLSEYDRRGYLSTKNARLVQPSDFMFIACPDRPSATRGVPVCQSAFSMLHRINDVCDSEAIAWQMISRLAVSITQEAGAQQNYVESEEDSQATSDAPLTNRITELDYALIFRGDPGDEIKGIERNIPGMNFSESLRMFLRLLGLPMGLPLELVLLDWTKSNYSQSRAVIEQANQTFIGWQKKLEEFFYTEIFNWKLEHWRQSGELRGQKDFEFSWIKPAFPWIDQLKEAQASGAKVDRAFSTHGEVCKSRGQDREEVVGMRDLEIRDAIERSQKIEADTGVKVPWEYFAGLEVKSAAPAAAGPERGANDKDDTETDKDANETDGEEDPSEEQDDE